MRSSLIILFTLLFSACASDLATDNTLIGSVPETATTVVHTQDLKTFSSELQSNTLTESVWSNLKKADSTNFLSALDTIQQISEAYFATSIEGNYALIGNYIDSISSINAIDSTTNITKHPDSIIINSSDALFKRNPASKKSFISTFNKPTSGNTLFLNSEKSKALFDLFLSDSLIKSGAISSLNLAIAPKQIQLHGVTKLQDTLFSRERLFDKSYGVPIQLDRITPSNALSLLTMDMPNIEDILKAKSVIDSTAITSDYFNILPTFEEIGQIQLTDSHVIVATSVDISTSIDALLAFQEAEETYKSETIFSLVNFTEIELLNQLFPKNITPKYYAVLDDFLIFSENVLNIKTIIDSYKSRNTLATSRSFISLKQHISDEASMQLYVSNEELNSTLKKVLKMSNLSLGKFSQGIIQLVQDDGFMHLNAAIGQPNTNNTYNTVGEEFSVTLDADLLNDPKFVTNHRTKQKEIVVQDVNNTLYLISNNGKILWRKKISGPIQGRIQQIDLYKNGRLQLAFVTPRKLHVIDRNGNDVLPYPKSFADEITQPLALFDYDNNRNYRFFIVQGDDVVLYDSKGKFVKGFNYKSSGNITSIPKHIRHRGKDYITFVAGNNLRILNRRGSDRVSSNLRFEHSENPVFFYQNKFTTSDASGNLIQVDLFGKSTSSKIANTKNHVLATTSKTLISQEENKLSIKGKNIELDFGSYLNPQLFYLNDKIYVSTIDLQTNNVMLYDSQTKPLANFPVFGSSQIDFENIDNDAALELVVKGDAKTIIVYQKN